MSARLITFLVTAAALSSHGQAAEGRLPYMIVGTNQTAVFNAQGRTTAAALNGSFSGQDADFEHPGPSYVDNGDGTVTDAVTGLMWEKGFRLLEISDAERTANAATTGGYDDWRVPTTKELYSLIEFSGAQGRRPARQPDTSF